VLTDFNCSACQTSQERKSEEKGREGRSCRERLHWAGVLASTLQLLIWMPGKRVRTARSLAESFTLQISFVCVLIGRSICLLLKNLPFCVGFPATCRACVRVRVAAFVSFTLIYIWGYQLIGRMFQAKHEIGFPCLVSMDRRPARRAWQ